MIVLPGGPGEVFFGVSAESSTLHILYREIIYIKELGFLPASLKRILTGSISHALQVVKPTLRTNHILSLSTYIYTHLNLYMCIRLCLYLYMCVFRWRNPHLEQITFCHYPLIYKYIYTFEPVYSYTFVSILVYGVFRWRNPLLEQITFCCYPYLFTYIHTYIQVRTYMHIYVYVYTCICGYLGGETHT